MMSIFTVHSIVPYSLYSQLFKKESIEIDYELLKQLEEEEAADQKRVWFLTFICKSFSIHISLNYGYSIKLHRNFIEIKSENIRFKIAINFKLNLMLPFVQNQSSNKIS